MMKKILENPFHALYDELWQMGSSFSQIIPPRYKTELQDMSQKMSQEMDTVGTWDLPHTIG
ncbi:hypothetical protein L3Q82_026849 [Scortum barcoo]|uniref:Uncharacterized protein n=1 Tax=Scortum barcoo TaxID=214431 RepID=A0ACB8WJW9_9TELE|nr:hypothetical protein L3Q82_026849 [Scortum barcoo]